MSSLTGKISTFGEVSNSIDMVSASVTSATDGLTTTRAGLPSSQISRAVATAKEAPSYAATIFKTTANESISARAIFTGTKAPSAAAVAAAYTVPTEGATWSKSATERTPARTETAFSATSTMMTSAGFHAIALVGTSTTTPVITSTTNAESMSTDAAGTFPSSPSSPSSKTGVLPLPKRSPGKRPSPWREPRVDHQLPPPAKDTVVHHGNGGTGSMMCAAKKSRFDPEKRATTTTTTTATRQSKKRQKRLYRKLFRDSVAVHIPLSVSADMGVALKRTRAKRVAALYKEFPALRPVAVGGGETEKDVHNNNIDDDDDLNGAATTNNNSKGETTTTAAGKSGETKKKLPKLKHVPQPHEYASVIDYLEAKYVQGVVIDDDASGTDNLNDDDDDEGQGSVYSETSFLDDTGLQRTVAEQVMGHTTTTKLEMQDSDDAFFVNVGDLEVEETDLTQQNYDPLEDTKGSKKPRKRKKSPAELKENDDETTNGKAKKTTNVKASAATTAKKLPSMTSAASVEFSPKKKKLKTSSKDDAEETTSVTSKKTFIKVKSETVVKDLSVLKLQKASKMKKAAVDSMYEALIAQIKTFTDDELPRKAKAKRIKVVVKIPKDNKPGDMITFANPHVPGQKLKVKVPPNTKPGDTFKVTVPQPAAPEEDADEDPSKDHNKISRDFYDKLEDYARTYDEWCDAEGLYKKAMGEKGFTPHFAKREKFDKLIKEFPNDMKTPVDKEYLKKILRRARQNKHKREQTLARQQHQQQQEQTSPNSKDDEENGSGSSNSASGSGSDDSSSDDDDDDEGKKEEAPAPKKATPPKPTFKKSKPMRMAVLPNLSLVFPSKEFRRQDFD